MKQRLNIVVWSVLLIMVNISCNENKIGILDTKDVIRIEIVNKTYKNYLKKNISVYDKAKIRLLVNEINNIKRINRDVNTKANLGYFNVSIILKNNSIKKMDILLTEYDGYVIVDIENSRRYRNDNLWFLLIRFLNQ